MSTTIKITPPGGEQQEIKVFDSCRVIHSATDRAGSFSLVLPDITGDLVDVFPVGSDVQIFQGQNEFRGWVVKPPKTLNGRKRIISLEGYDYTARTQKIIVTESYTDTAISDIVSDLFLKYVSWATRTNIQTNSRQISITLPDMYLWDAMEQICELSGYDWYIDENLDVNFFEPITRTNENIMEEGTYKKGTASFTPDASKLVNRLWVKGCKAISDPFTQNITVGTTPIQLYYTPRAGTDGITVTIGGAEKTLGIQYIDDPGTKDFLINAQEKLLIPDLCTSVTGTIVYCYEYPVKILLEDLESQATYGLFEDVLEVNTDDKTLAREQGLIYLNKYSKPVITGSIQPFSGTYKAGELLKINIPALNINGYMQIKQVEYYSRAGTSRVDIKLQLESPERELTDILKDMNSRLAKLEKSVYNDDEGPVEQYKVFSDAFLTPQMIDSMTWTLHQYPICGQFICGTDVII